MSLVEGIAAYLDSIGIGTYDASGMGGDIFLFTVPQSPDQAISIFQYGGPESPISLQYDQPSIQVRVRGTQDPRGAHSRALDVYLALHGIGHTTLPSGDRVVDIVGVQSGPVWLRQDENGRHEYVCNFRTDVARAA